MTSYTSILFDMLRPQSSAASSSLKDHWEPTRSMRSLAGYTVVLTGPTSGIGYETLRQLVLSSAHVYLFGRSISRLEHTRDTILSDCTAALSTHQDPSEYSAGDLRFGAQVGRMTLIQCDLSSLHSIQHAAQQFLSMEQTVDLVFANAGVMQAGTTADGFEMMFGTNVLGHHALLKLLLPALRTSAQRRNSKLTGETRVVITASNTHRWVNLPTHLALSPDATNPALGHIHLYGRSKLGNIYTASKLAELSSEADWGIVVCSVHPGGVKSQLGSSNRLLTQVKNWFLIPAPLGAVTQLWGGVGAQAKDVNARYLVPYARVGEESELAKNKEVRDAVWHWCEEQCVKLGVVAKQEDEAAA